MEPLEYLRILRRRWAVVLAAAVIGAAAAWFTAPSPTEAEAARSFQATHTLYRDPFTPNPSQVTLDTMALLATTGDIPRRVADRIAPDTEPALLATQVEVTANQQLGTLVFTSTGRDGDRAAEIANAFAEETLRYFDERDAARQLAATERLSEQLRILEERIRELDARLTELAPPPETLDADVQPPPAGADVELVRAERDAYIRQYGFTVEQLNQLTSEQAGAAGLVTLQAAVPVPVVDAGFQPPASAEGRAGLGALLGGLLGVVLAVMLERLDVRIRSRRGAQAAFGLPVLAEVPRLRRWRRRSRIVVVDRPASYAAEAFRMLRLSLQLPVRATPAGNQGGGQVSGRVRNRPARNGHPAKVVLVTSPGPAEGKTTTAANLAAAFAEVGRRVLVVDLDFRHAEQHRYFQAERTPGLTDHLTRGDDPPPLEGLVQPTLVPGVSLLANGTFVDNPGELLGADHELVRHVAELADVVIIDAGPLLSVNEPLALVPQVDAVVVVARSGKTTAEFAARTGELLDRVHAPVTGVVLLGVPRSVASQPYYAAARSTPLRRGKPPRRGEEPQAGITVRRSEDG